MIRLPTSSPVRLAGLILGAAALLALPGCQTTAPAESAPLAMVATVGEPGWFFTKDATYAWRPIAFITAGVPPERLKAVGTLMHDEGNLWFFERGIERDVNPANADYQLYFTLTLDRNLGPDELRRSYRQGRGGRFASDETQTQTKGALVLDIVDRRRNTMVWRGQLEGALPPQPLPPEQADRRLRAALRHLLESCPAPMPVPPQPGEKLPVLKTPRR